jgi:hypothetical protein
MGEGDSNERTFDLAAVETRLRIDAAGRTCIVDRDRPIFTFGRDADNDLALGDEFASRHHGQVVYRDGRFHLTDDSRNGTIVIFGMAAMHLARNDTVLLHGRGSVRLGHPDGQGFAFIVEIRARESGTWQLAVESREAPDDIPSNVFRRDGDFWTIRYAGRVVRLKDVLGARYLAQLLRYPMRDFHVLDLALLAAEGSGDVDVLEHARVVDGAGPFLDARARAEYRSRLAELREQLEEAERFNDIGRVERTRDELEAVSRALAGAVGLGGRDREAASNAERCRVAVTRRIRDALARIARNHPDLGEHLYASVRTGLFCSYRPGSARRVKWET